MAAQTATFTAANVGTLRQALSEVSARLAAENEQNPPAITIVTDTAGTVTFSMAAYQGNAAYSRAVTASVA